MGGVKCSKARFVLCDSIDVVWGDISQTEAEMLLFKKVLNQGQYRYVHLISGSDLPLKSQDEIHDFFSHTSEDYLDMNDYKPAEKRMKYYHFFVRLRVKYPLFNFFRRILLIPQLLFVNRNKYSDLPYSFGANWCSLTYSTTKLLVERYQKYKRRFRYTTNCDEHYKQMLLKDLAQVKISELGNLRYVRFDPGMPSPRILTEKDYLAVMTSNCLFARKFDIRIDKNVVSKIICNLKK